MLLVVEVEEVDDDRTIVLRSARGGPVNLLTVAGTVCRRIWVEFVEFVAIVCVTGPVLAGPTRSN